MGESKRGRAQLQQTTALSRARISSAALFDIWGPSLRTRDKQEACDPAYGDSAPSPLTTEDTGEPDRL